MTDTAEPGPGRLSLARARFLPGPPARARPQPGAVRLRTAVPQHAARPGAGTADATGLSRDRRRDRPCRPAGPGARDRRRRLLPERRRRSAGAATSSPSCRASAPCSRSSRVRGAGRRAAGAHARAGGPRLPLRAGRHRRGDSRAPAAPAAAGRASSSWTCARCRRRSCRNLVRRLHGMEKTVVAEKVETRDEYQAAWISASTTSRAIISRVRPCWADASCRRRSWPCWT